MSFNDVVSMLNDIVWSQWLVWLCLGTGVIFSVWMLLPQVRLIPDMIKYLFASEDSDSGVTSFQSFAMALGGRVGTGNIAGVATAIGFGGPGAVFWMWAIAFLGASSAYIEAALAQVWKVEMDGEYRGGPAYYIEKGIGQKWYAALFAISAVVGVGIFLPGIQANGIAVSMNQAFNIPTYFTGAVVVALLGLIVFGGVKRIGAAAGVIVPFMATAYIILALVIIAINITEVPRVFGLIISSAFSLNAAFGAIVGQTIMWGVKRGIYSNEAGQGTGPMAAAAAEVSHPAKQGLVQAFSVYVDTLFVCSATAFMILLTGAYSVFDEMTILGNNPETGENIYQAIQTSGIANLAGINPGPEYTQAAVDTLIPGFGSAFVAIALFFFAFTTLMAYVYYAESNVAYLVSHLPNHGLILNITKVGILIMTFVGAINSKGAVWALGDVGVGVMAWLNIIAILILGKVGVATLKDYEKQKKQGLDPVFDPKAIGIHNADFWENYKR